MGLGTSALRRLFSRRSSTARVARKEQEGTLGGARVLLAIGSLLAACIDPRYAGVSFGPLQFALLVFLLHSFIVLILVRHRPAWVYPYRPYVHVADTVWVACILGLAQSADKPLYLSFPMLLFLLSAAAYRWGLRETIGTSIVCIAVLFVSGITIASTRSTTFGIHAHRMDLADFARRAVYVILTAYIIGYVGEREREVRDRASLISRLLGRVRLQTGLRDAVDLVVTALLAIFGGKRALVVIRDEKKGRVYLWDTEPTLGVENSNQRWTELDPFQHKKYLFTLPDASCYAVRRNPHNRAEVPQISAWGASGERLGRFYYSVPDYFLAWHDFATLLLVPFSLGDDKEWSGRLFLFDLREPRASESAVTFLREIVGELAPAIYALYRLRRVRSRARGIERAHIAQELHDGVIQTLISINSRLDLLRKSRTAGTLFPADELARFQRWLRDEISGVRDLMQEIRSLDLTSATLLERVADLLDKFQQDTGIQTELSSEAKHIALPPTVAREVVRIVSEALANVRRHSGARNVRVHFAYHNEALTLIVEDNGRGFDFSGRLSQSELDASRRGPAVIRERVRSIGGELTIESRPGSGARLEIAVAPPAQVAAIS